MCHASIISVLAAHLLLEFDCKCSLLTALNMDQVFSLKRERSSDVKLCIIHWVDTWWANGNVYPSLMAEQKCDY